VYKEYIVTVTAGASTARGTSVGIVSLNVIGSSRRSLSFAFVGMQVKVVEVFFVEVEVVKTVE
jgi:hypothetical protein